MSKSADAFRTIGEVSLELGVPKHVLRFWEQRFKQLKPMKLGGGRRFYRPEDVELLAGIKRLLYEHSIAVKGVQRILRDQGVEHVKAIGAGTTRLATVAALAGSAGAANVAGAPGDTSARAKPLSSRKRKAAAESLPHRGEQGSSGWSTLDSEIVRVLTTAISELQACRTALGRLPSDLPSPVGKTAAAPR